MVVLSKYFRKFHDFSMIIQVFFKFHDFSMHGTFLVIFQVFQSLWEPCHMHFEKEDIKLLDLKSNSILYISALLLL